MSNAKRDTSQEQSQTTDAVFMIRPMHFGPNAETARSNFFQQSAPLELTDSLAAQREFDALAAALTRAGVRVIVFSGRTDIALPDEVFPNNWVSLHADGSAVLYPMLAENRRRERRPELLDALRSKHGYELERVIDLTAHEENGHFLEGTGSLVLDRVRRVAYACVSPRTSQEALAAFGRALDYETVSFRGVDGAGRPIYHTNVLMALGTAFAAICTRAVADEGQRSELEARFEHDGREIIDLGFEQLAAFAGNLLELRGARGPVIAISATAIASFDAHPRRRLERHGELVVADVATIERIGGGSVRCMLAEVALPRTARQG